MRADLESGLRAWARGSYAYEAGTELIIRSVLGERMENGGYILTHDDDPDVGEGYAYPDVRGLAKQGPGLSGGERRLLAVVANLLNQEDDEDGERRLVPLSLPNLAGLDRGNCALVVAALAHCLGSHQQSDMRLVNGRPEFVDYPPLVVWP